MLLKSSFHDICIWTSLGKQQRLEVLPSNLKHFENAKASLILHLAVQYELLKFSPVSPSTPNNLGSSGSIPWGHYSFPLM